MKKNTSIPSDFQNLAVLHRGGGQWHALVAKTNGVLELTKIGRLLYDRVTFNFYPAWALAWLSERRTSSGSAVA